MEKKEIIKRVSDISSKELTDIDWEYYWIGREFSSEELEKMTEKQLNTLLELVRTVGEYYY